MGAPRSDILSAGANASRTPPRETRRSFYLFIIAALLSLIGLADSIYLTVEHLAGRAVRCTITSGCEQVLSSAYATVAGIPLAALGALAYFLAFSLAILAAFGYKVAANLMVYLVGSMLIVSIYLFVLQAFVLHAFCQFCLLSAAVTLALSIIIAAERFYFRRRV